MSKRKNTSHKRQSHNTSPKQPGISYEVYDKIKTMMKAGEWQKAHSWLRSLAVEYPSSDIVMALLLESSEKLGDYRVLEYAAIKLYRIDPNNPQSLLSLADVYHVRMRPMLALKTLSLFIKRWPKHPKASNVAENIEMLRPLVQEALEENGITGPMAFEIGADHEESQSLADIGEYAQSRRLAELVLKRHPNFAPAWNNIAMTFVAECDFTAANEMSLKVLEFEPDNIHALANLVEGYSRIGDKVSAVQYADRLKASQAPAWHRRLKVAVALSHIGDDQGVLDVYDEDRENDETDENDAIMAHYAGAAACRLGDESRARDLWHHALQLDPNLQIVTDNLKDLDLPLGERHGPVTFNSHVFLSESFMSDIKSFVEGMSDRSEEAEARLVGKLIRRHPEIILQAPMVFDYGDKVAVELLLLLAKARSDAQLLPEIKRFALGIRGSDDLRMKALSIVHQFDPTIENNVEFWSKGERANIELVGYEIYSTAQPTGMSKEVQSLYESSYHAIQDKDYQKAEILLEQALAIAPDNPSLLNNLCLVREATGRKDEAISLLERIVGSNPDYFFARCSLASIRAMNGRVEEAKDLIAPLLKQRRLHVSEHSALCCAQIEILLAEGKPEGVKTWANMLENTNPDHPILIKLQAKRII